ncbi:MAG TPA: alkaline phosphatase family protein [Allosphingosinicella sp.]
MGARIAVIAFDACDPDLARRLAVEGRMPNLRRLLAQGAHSPVDNPFGLFVGALWVSFASCQRPARHGYHCWDEIDVASYEWRLRAPDPSRYRSFWSQIGAAGLRVAAVDVPHSLPRDDLNGVEVAEWGCHDRHFGLRSTPQGLAHEWKQTYGLHPVLGAELPGEPHLSSDDFVFRKGRYRTPAEEKSFFEHMVAGARTKSRILRDLLAQEEWDLFVAVFGESHALGHQQWHLHDSDHPRFTADARRAVGCDPVETLYEELDRAFGQIMAEAGPDTTILLHLSHGMAGHYDGTHLLDEVLKRLDSPQQGARRQSSALARLAKPHFPFLQAAAARLGIPRALSRKVAQRLRGDSGANRAARRFFQEPNNSVYAGIRINLAGREPQGRVLPSEVDALYDELERELLALKDDRTGGPAVRAVTRSDSVHERRPGDAMPDLFVEWNRSGAPIERVSSSTIGRVHVPYTHWRTGDHRPAGLLVGVGPGIEVAGEQRAIAVEDIGVTVAARLGAEVGDADGEVIPWLGIAREQRAATERV